MQKCRMDPDLVWKMKRQELREASRQMIGYPIDLSEVPEDDYPPDLKALLLTSLNNIGDPFVGSSMPMNTHDIERLVIEFFLELNHLPLEEGWGYVTSGGTEGNMAGLDFARECHPKGMLYFSDQTHYSLRKLVRIMRFPFTVVRSTANGELDHESLREEVSRRQHMLLEQVEPVIVCANIGTTMFGAVDDIFKITEVLDELGVKDRYYHLDAAFSGMTLPFLEGVKKPNFKNKDVQSMAVSGHKLMGCREPCGIFLSRQEHAARITTSVEYIGSRDATISGSRSGHAPLRLWHAIQTRGIDGFRARAERSLLLAKYLFDGLQVIGWPAWLNENSSTVVLKRPSDDIVKGWRLSVENDIAHIIMMPHVTKEVLDRLVKALWATG